MSNVLCSGLLESIVRSVKEDKDRSIKEGLAKVGSFHGEL